MVVAKNPLPSLHELLRIAEAVPSSDEDSSLDSEDDCCSGSENVPITLDKHMYIIFVNVLCPIPSPLIFSMFPYQTFHPLPLKPFSQMMKMSRSKFSPGHSNICRTRSILEVSCYAVVLPLPLPFLLPLPLLLPLVFHTY